MVQIHALLILNKTNIAKGSKPVILAGHVEGGAWYTWLYKDTLKEFAVFFSRLLAEKTEPGVRQQVSHEKYVGYVHAQADGLVGVLLTDDSYPVRVAFDLVRKCLNGFDNAKKFQNPNSKDWCCTEYSATIQEMVKKYQDPTEADKLLKVKGQIEDTKVELGRALESLLERGKKIDDLIAQTDQLSEEAKGFYIKARKNNSCCTIL